MYPNLDRIGLFEHDLNEIELTMFFNFLDDLH